MKVVILAGGYGTRLGEETQVKPKPMVEVGDKPLLWHIMKIYSHYGFNDFIICLGYKGYMIKEYFSNYFMHQSDVTIDLKNNNVKVHHSKAEPWQITLVDTGLNSMTGGRIRRVSKYIGDEPFMLTYGDGVGDVNIPQLLKYHKSHKKLATMTSVQPSGRFGAIKIDEKDRVVSFVEKPKGDGARINGGFFVLEPGVMDYIDSDLTFWEKEPLEQLAKDKELFTYKHPGFWQPMDTLRDKNQLEEMWSSGKAPWKVW